MTQARTRSQRFGGGEGDPRPLGPRRHGSVPVMAAKLHDAWCDWPYRTRDANRRDLAFCGGCGLYIAIEIGAAPACVERTRPRAIASPNGSVSTVRES